MRGKGGVTKWTDHDWQLYWFLHEELPHKLGNIWEFIEYYNW